MTGLQVEFLILAILIVGAVATALLLRRKKPSLEPDGEILVVPNDEEGITELHFRINPSVIESGADQVVLQVRRQ